MRAGGCGLLLLPILALTLALPVAPAAEGTPTKTAIVLPGASSAEGIAAGQGSSHGALYTVNPNTGTSAVIAGVSVPNVDGLLHTSSMGGVKREAYARSRVARKAVISRS